MLMRASVQVRVGHITAQCPDCGGTRFTPVGLEPARTLVCNDCGVGTTRGCLLEQIGEEAMRQARASLRELRAKKDGP